MLEVPPDRKVSRKTGNIGCRVEHGQQTAGCARRVREPVHAVLTPKSSSQTLDGPDPFADPFGMVAAGGVESHPQGPVSAAQRPACPVVGAVRDRTVSVEQAAQEGRKQGSWHVDRTKR